MEGQQSIKATLTWASRKVPSYKSHWAPARSLSLGVAGRGWDPQPKYVTESEGRPPVGSAFAMRIGLGGVEAETWPQTPDVGLGRGWGQSRLAPGHQT